MGTYVFTARATRRLPAFVDGGVHTIFPLVYSFKPWYGHPRNDSWWSHAWRQADRIENRPDWTGYVSFNGAVYKTNSALWIDSDPIGEFKGNIFASPRGAEVR
jgi:hypothetical protein